MKKLLALLLVLLLCFSCLLSCDENEESSSESSSVIEPSDTPKAPNETKTQVKHTEKYYRQISLKYYKITNTPVTDAEREAFKAFSEGRKEESLDDSER